MIGRAHIVGAGLSGLSAAVQLAKVGIPVAVYEGAGHGGGRCRSYFDSELKRVVDNGNHLVLSGNRSVLNYLDLIGAGDTIKISTPAEIQFMDLADRSTWALRPGAGPLSWFRLSSQLGVPGVGLADYIKCWRLIQAKDYQVISDVLPTSGVLWEKFWSPLIVAVTNTDPMLAAAEPMKRVIFETLIKGETACRTVSFPAGLTASLVDPAIEYIKRQGGNITFNHSIRHIQTSNNRITCLKFGQDRAEINARDIVIFALPSSTVNRLTGGIEGPNEYSPIVNGHFRVPNPIDAPPVLGLINSVAEWLFLKNDIVSVTASAAGSLVGLSPEVLSEIFWRDIRAAYNLKVDVVPPSRIVKEKRATFLQTPSQLRRRPPCRTHFNNLFLAGDWTQTGLPATIEGSVKSGVTAANEASTYMS